AGVLALVAAGRPDDVVLPDRRLDGAVARVEVERGGRLGGVRGGVHAGDAGVVETGVHVAPRGRAGDREDGQRAAAGAVADREGGRGRRQPDGRDDVVVPRVGVLDRVGGDASHDLRLLDDPELERAAGAVVVPAHRDLVAGDPQLRLVEQRVRGFARHGVDGPAGAGVGAVRDRQLDRAVA